MSASHFVHLRLHSEFSVVDGTNRIDDVVNRAAQDGQPALAITDLNNLFGAVKHYKESRGKGVKPLIGADVQFVNGRLLLLVQNHQGYLNLCELLARAWTHSAATTHAVCRLEWLSELGEGLICLSGASTGGIAQA